MSTSRRRRNLIDNRSAPLIVGFAALFCAVRVRTQQKNNNPNEYENATISFQNIVHQLTKWDRYRGFSYAPDECIVRMTRQ